jgi:hypothetical protein
VTVGALFVPGFDRFYGTVLESIPFREEQEIRVLDLGAGLLTLPRTEGGYDLEVSAFSVHHLTHGNKRELFDRVHHALAGGHFVNADHISGKTPEEGALYKEWWLCEAGVSEEDLGAAVSRMRADRNATLGAQLLWLGEAVFEGIGCRHKDHRFAVYNGRKGHENSETGKDADE